MLAQKHTTSKLREFDDLTSLNTFGFRGEALSSLCAISENVTVHTRCKEQAIGIKLEYDRDGKLRSRTSAPRDVGTTVTLLGIFTALPVRHKDFLKNKTREYQRLLRRLQGYALIHSDKRFVCSNQTAKARHNVLTTHGTGKMLDCLTSIFGAKQKDSVAEVRLECGTKVVIEGLISKGTANTGLSTSDRQFLYLNKRPVDVPKLSKVWPAAPRVQYRVCDVLNSPQGVDDALSSSWMDSNPYYAQSHVCNAARFSTRSSTRCTSRSTRDLRTPSLCST